MKMKFNKKIISLVLMFSMGLGLSAFASGDIYVNDGQSTLDGNIDDAYAVGGSGNVDKVAGAPAKALTGNGLEDVGTPPSPSPTPPPVHVATKLLNVGLYYGSNAMPVANLKNVVGSGFTFGFYDANKTFYSVGSTNETEITMVKDQNVSVGAGVVGCFHILLPSSYNSFQAASQAASQYSDGFPAYYSGTYRVLVGQYQARADAVAAATARGIRGEAFSASNRCVTVTKTGTTKILFEFDYGSNFSLAIRPISTSGKARTLFRNNTYYGDFQYNRLSGGDMTVSNFVDIEDYVKGVVPYEMSASWPREALKAQAVCARTYAVVNINKHKSSGFELCNTTDCQVYYGIGAATANSDAACDGTAGIYMSSNGQLCSAVYSSSDGGATENSENVWANYISYLRGVKDPYEASIEFPNKTWNEVFTGAQIRQKLQSRGYNISAIVSITPAYTEMENMNRLTFTDDQGKSVSITKDLCRTVMGVKSINYRLTKSSTQEDTYLLNGGGWGHNVGMSQWGAYSMASVHGKNYVDILTFYYTGVTVG